MRLLNISTLNPGQKLSYPIKTQDGKILLSANSVLTEKFISRLKSFNIMSVYVKDEFFGDVCAKPTLTDETKTFALGAVDAAYKSILSKKPVNINNIKIASKEIVKDVRVTLNGEPVGMFNTYAVSDEKCLHAVNVAAITSIISFEHRLNLIAVEDYTFAALMHDLFLKSMNDDSNHEHAELMKNHLKSSHECSVRAYMSVAGHHEKFDGTGANKIAGEKIPEGARIIAVADMYDNLVYGLSGQKKLDLHYAVERLNLLSGKALDPQFVKYFNSSVAIYPLGSTVVLNNGYKAVVIAQNNNMPTRPRVRLSMPKREDCIEINLLTNLTTFIEKVV